MIYICRNI